MFIHIIAWNIPEKIRSIVYGIDVNALDKISESISLI
jgi:hypothetical protein